MFCLPTSGWQTQLPSESPCSPAQPTVLALLPLLQQAFLAALCLLLGTNQLARHSEWDDVKLCGCAFGRTGARVLDIMQRAFFCRSEKSSCVYVCLVRLI